MGGLANTKRVQRRRQRTSTDEFGLTVLERKFADLVLKNPEMTQGWCYLRAGYKTPSSKKMLHKYASKTIRRPQVQAYLEMRRKQLAKKVNVSQNDVVTELYNIGFFDPADLFTEDGCLKQITEIPEGARKAISQIDVFTEYDGRGENREAIGQTTRIKFVDKKGALDSLARYLGMFKQDQIDTNGIAELMGLVAQARGGSTIGRLNSVTAEGSVLRPALEAEQSVLDPGQGGQRGPLPSQLGAGGAAPKLLVHERHPEGATAGDDDVPGHPSSR